MINFIDEKYAQGELDGYQYDDMPDDRDAWRLVARGLDEQAGAAVGGRRRSPPPTDDVADAIVDGLRRRRAERRQPGTSSTSSARSAWSCGSTLSCFYSHPWAWNEIGFGGPAYPRGYSRFGSPQLQHAERETWEGREAFDRDPVSERREHAADPMSRRDSLIKGVDPDARGQRLGVAARSAHDAACRTWIGCAATRRARPSTWWSSAPAPAASRSPSGWPARAGGS